MFYQILSMWVDLMQENRTIFKELLKKRGLDSVAIYGMANLGKKLLRQFRNEGVNVTFVIDQAGGNKGENLPIFRPYDDLPKCDLIIITSFDEGNIKKMLEGKTKARIIHIKDLLTDIIETF